MLARRGITWSLAAIGTLGASAAWAADGAPVVPPRAPAFADRAEAISTPAVRGGAWELSATPYYVSTEMKTDNLETSLDANVTGVFAALRRQLGPQRVLSLKANLAQTDVDFTFRPLSLNIDSYALGAQLDLGLDPVDLAVGASIAYSRFESQLQLDRDRWSGIEGEAHIAISSRQPLGGPVSIRPLLGFRALQLSQDSHDIGSEIIPRETRRSLNVFGGASLELAVETAPGLVFNPWLFAGGSYEIEDRPPQGPSVFLAEQMAGSRFTAFSNEASGVPNPFPSHFSKIVGAGLSTSVTDTFSLVGAAFHEMNDDFHSTFLRVGFRLAF